MEKAPRASASHFPVEEGLFNLHSVPYRASVLVFVFDYGRARRALHKEQARVLSEVVSVSCEKKCLMHLMN